MKIIALTAENYKRLRVVEITPKGRVVQITGKNGQGKTSVLDAIWTAVVGAKGMPEKPVRAGATKARIRVDLGELVVTRVIHPDGSHALTVENAKGSKIGSPQKVLDELLGALTFDPLLFITKQPNESTNELRRRQIETLRTVAKIDFDVEAMNAANLSAIEARRDLNREVSNLKANLSSIVVQQGLPAEKINEVTILQQLEEAGERNQAIAQQREAYQSTAEKLNTQRLVIQTHERMMEGLREQIAKLQNDLAEAEERRQRLFDEESTLSASLAAMGTAPELVDVSDLTRQLQQAQLINREISKRERAHELEKQIREKEQAAEGFSRAIEQREEQKREAIRSAALPVEGLSFDESHVLFNGIPMEQLGEAEAIRVSTAIAMAANPKLRILRIMHGEALDDDSMKLLAKMAEENDFQIWMAKVDSSGKVGIVMEDGQVKEAHE